MVRNKATPAHPNSNNPKTSSCCTILGNCLLLWSWNLIPQWDCQRISIESRLMSLTKLSYLWGSRERHLKKFTWQLSHPRSRMANQICICLSLSIMLLPIKFMSFVHQRCCKNFIQLRYQIHSILTQIPCQFKRFLWFFWTFFRWSLSRIWCCLWLTFGIKLTLIRIDLYYH